MVRTFVLKNDIVDLNYSLNDFKWEMCNNREKLYI